MVRFDRREWIADLEEMTCRNMNNRIIVRFEKKGHSLTGKIHEIPIKLRQFWDRFPNSDRLVHKTITDAKKIFLQEYARSGARQQQSAG